MQNLGKNIKFPTGGGGGAAGRLASTVLIGGAAIYGATQSLFNVEGGHRAIVFNRLTGIKERVRCWPVALHPCLVLDCCKTTRHDCLVMSRSECQCIVDGAQVERSELRSLRRCMKKGRIS